MAIVKPIRHRLEVWDNVNGNQMIAVTDEVGRRLFTGMIEHVRIDLPVNRIHKCDIELIAYDGDEN